MRKVSEDNEVVEDRRENYVLAGTKLPPAVLERLRRMAEEQDRSVSAIIRRAINWYLDSIDEGARRNAA